MSTRVGIVGDGQLGMLLCEAAPTLDIHTAILTGSADSPAALRADTAVVGGMQDTEALEALIQASDIVTYEREDVDPVAIAALRAAEEAGRIQCFPHLATIETIQDKAKQKTWLAGADLPTLPFHLSDGSEGQAEIAAGKLGYPLVQKALRGGFDGRGVQLLRDAGALAGCWPGETLFEAFAGNFREIAVIVARGRDGEVRYFPPVDMTFDSDYSVLDWVFAPSALDADTVHRAEEIAVSAVESLDGVGVFGVEMFHLESGEVLINEISPRVHNAGHYTLDATACSQFEQHLRAVTGLPLADTDLQRPAAMRNLLCTDALRPAAEGRSAACLREGPVAVYWYGKEPARAMRKLGHITATGDSSSDAAERVSATYDGLLQQGVANARGERT
jgi:5-(carboxyamino)imidazole ribonucleotide synthase